MKICFIGPGEIEIPPIGWGALETVLWNQYTELKKFGIETYFCNERDTDATFNLVSKYKPDIIHLHYGNHYRLMPQFDCRKIVTNHDGSFRNSFRFHDAIARAYLRDCEFFCLSEQERKFFTNIGISTNKVKIMPNGVCSSLFFVSNNPSKPNRSLCIGKIDARKRQSSLQKINVGVDFVGAVDDENFNSKGEDYLGSWNREQIYMNTTEYANLVILSSSENCSPLVCLEALSAGLGLVISEACTESLDLSKKFITVIPENKVNDKEFVQQSIKENRIASLSSRQQIVEYSKTRSWSNMMKIYTSYL